MRVDRQVIVFVVAFFYIQICEPFTASIRKPPSPPSRSELDIDPKKKMWNKLEQISPDGKSEFMKVALRESISGKFCKFPSAYKDYIAWDCVKDRCPIDLKPGEKPANFSLQINSKTWEKCSPNQKSDQFWEKNKNEYLEWAKIQGFYNVSQIYQTGNFIYLPIAQRNSVNNNNNENIITTTTTNNNNNTTTTINNNNINNINSNNSNIYITAQQCVLPSVGYGSKSDDILTDCQNFNGDFQCQVVVVEESVKATRFQRSGENVEKLVWSKCDMGSQTNQFLKNQQIVGSDNINNKKSSGLLNLWWIVLFVALFAIFLVTFVWWKNKQNKKGEILENIDCALDDENENENAHLVQNSGEHLNFNQTEFQQQLILQNNHNQLSQNEIQVETDQQKQNEEIDSKNLIREQELAKIGL